MYLQEVNFQDTNLQNKKVFNNFRIRSAMSSLRRLFLAQTTLTEIYKYRPRIMSIFLF